MSPGSHHHHQNSRSPRRLHVRAGTRGPIFFFLVSKRALCDKFTKPMKICTLHSPLDTSITLIDEGGRSAPEISRRMCYLIHDSYVSNIFAFTLTSKRAPASGEPSIFRSVHPISRAKPVRNSRPSDQSTVQMGALMGHGRSRSPQQAGKGLSLAFARSYSHYKAQTQSRQVFHAG